METPSHEIDPSFAEEVEARGRTLLRSCLFCMSCSGGCPFFAHMDFGPHGILRRVILGLRKEVLSSNTIWRCVGCHTCAAVCPMAIDIVRVMDVLRRMAVEEGTVADPAILDFTGRSWAPSDVTAGPTSWRSCSATRPAPGHGFKTWAWACACSPGESST